MSDPTAWPRNYFRAIGDPSGRRIAHSKPAIGQPVEVIELWGGRFRATWNGTGWVSWCGLPFKEEPIVLGWRPAPEFRGE